jgi:Phage endonuclease I
LAIPAYKRRVRKHGKFRSGLEKSFAEVLDLHSIPYKYEKTKLKYIVPEKEHSYTVDFDIKKLHIETKGRLTSFDRKKMLHVKESNPDLTIVFVFDNSNKKINKNSPTTYADWCNKNGFHYFDIKQLTKDISPLCQLPTIAKQMNGSVKTPPKKKKKP